MVAAILSANDRSLYANPDHFQIFQHFPVIAAILISCL